MSSATSVFKVLPVEHATDGLFEELKDLQRKFEYLPADELKRVAERRGRVGLQRGSSERV